MSKPTFNQAARQWAATSASSMQFATSLGREIVDVVEGMHGTIANTPQALLGKTSSTRGLTRFVYGCVRFGFDTTERVWRTVAAQISGTPNENSHLGTMGVATLNGVFGDALERSNNHLAIPMSLHTLSSRVNAATLIIFSHGLCMNEQGWLSPTHQQFVEQQAVIDNADIAYIRYNTGRHIEQNSQDLKALLARSTEQYQRIVLIGHSMGGLLYCSALHQANQHGDSEWLKKVSHLVTLGSPHEGAPLERAGKLANSMLKVSPYSTPLSRLGDLRSAGIRDLHDGKPDSLSLPSHIRLVLVAATRSELLPDIERKAKHDLLVTLESALARHKIVDEHVKRHVFVNMDHMQLLHDQRVYEHMPNWLLH